jgi:hypothetical protein
MISENRLELILVDDIGFSMSFYICIPTVSYGVHKMVRGQHDLLLVVALHNLKFLLHHLVPVINVHGFHGVREDLWLDSLEFSKLVSLLWLWCLLVLLHVGHSLLHGLEHLSFHHQNLLQGRWGGGVGLKSLLFSALLFSALALRLLVLVI